MNKKIISGLVVALSGLSSVSQASEFKPASVRALGMGGSNVASTKGVEASYWNPAAYGFFGERVADEAVDNSNLSTKDVGFTINTDAGAYLFGTFEKNYNIAKALPNTVSNANGTFSSQQMVDAARLSQGVAQLDPRPGGVNILAGATVGGRVANYGLGLRVFAEVNNSVAIDTQNRGLDLVNAFAGGASLPAPAAPVYFSVPQRDQMIASLQTGGKALTAQQANAVVAAYDQALFQDKTAVGQQQVMTSTLITIHSAPGDLTKNNTVVSTRGVVISEVGVTYGYGINDNLSFGTVLKYLRADMVATDVLIFSNPNANTTSFNRGNKETSSGVGIDLGMMYRIPAWQFGLTARNVNAPSFEHKASGYVYTLKPQAKVGVAWIPSDTFTVEAGYDITKNNGAVANSESQYWNAGLEWDALSILTLRMGAFENIAQSDIGLVPTLGLGLDLWAARIDIGGAISTKRVVLDGKKRPVYAMASAAITMDF